jgi:hypothetical protein
MLAHGFDVIKHESLSLSSSAEFKKRKKLKSTKENLLMFVNKIKRIKNMSLLME